MSEPIQLHEILEWAAQRSPHLDTSDLSRWIREYASSIANERTATVTAERDALLPWKETALDLRRRLTTSEAELSELRARVERAKALLPKIIEDHEYDEGKYGVYDDLVALLAILEGSKSEN